ncbi:hypothetical protein BurJ1DRAFT_4806 [Burkholderiales bacterium JOSHI_001]|nr:hypothetical protein BurJ1DRAFT_4806 [Burkholderiales bacterium JOSHI_001]
MKPVKPLPTVTLSDADRRQVMRRLGALALGGATAFVAGRAHAAPAAPTAPAEEATYDQGTVMQAASEFFGNTTEGLARVIERAFAEQGRPNGFIRGEEAALAISVGVRYGEGDLVLRDGSSHKLYWSGPSVGVDLGANASKVFVLVYHLPDAQAIYKRFPGVDGSLYYVGGVGMNYQRLNGVVLAPIRLGVGLRAGASVGYVHYRREKSFNPL